MLAGAASSSLSPSTWTTRCGRAPHELRPCTPTDAAVRQQGPSCLRAARRIPAVHSAKVVNNCSCRSRPTLPAGDQWERRADAARRAAG